MTGATVCSGIGAPECALPEIEWKWCAEIEPFPSAVLHPNLGDISAPDFIERAQAYGEIDILVAGTPCQAFSVAGERRSFEDERGNLTLRFVEIVHAIKPRLVLWENVPGVLSTLDNAFGCFLARLVGNDEALDPGERWTDAGMAAGPSGTAAWRILDAQYFGLAQRRKRVFVVFSPRTSGDPAEILFEFESLRRDFAPRREAGQGTAPTISARTQGDGGLGTDFDCDGGLVAHALNGKGGMGRIDGESETFVVGTLPSGGTPRGHGVSGVNDQAVNAGHVIPAVSPTLRSGGKPGQGYPAVAFLPQGYRIQDVSGASETISCNPNGGMRVSPIAYNLRGREGGANLEETDVASLRSASGGSSRTYVGVRRLTPRECERLQGFPDDYTLIPYRGKPAADGPRYKTLGNSMAVPVIRWILRRTIAELSRPRVAA